MSSRHGDGLRTYRNRLSNMILLRSKSLRSSVNSTRGSVNISNLDPRVSTESITSDSTHLCSPAGSTTALSSSSHTTPLLSSVHMNAVDQSPWNDPVPPTTNDLDAKEKARLLKKARKLSKVFGDVLTIEPPSPTLSHNRRASEPHTSRRPASAGGGGPNRHRRGHHSQHDSMAGNLTLPQITEVISFKDRPGSRTRTRHAVKASLSLGGTLYPAASSTPSLYSPSLKSSVDGDDQSSVISATPTIPTRLSPERARRATMAKLTRHLGENIPPQLIPHIVDRTPEVEPDRPWLRKKRRRRSLDSISLGSRLFTVPEGMADVTRSRSFSNKSKGKDPAYRSSVDFHHHYGLSFEANRSGDQRLNVKRARKMVKLFGEEPPADLIQYHSGGTSEGAREDTASHDISIPPTPELSASPSLKSRPMSPSTIDSVSSPSDAFHHTRDPSDQLEPVIAVNPDDLEPPLTPITPTSPKPGGPSGFSDRRRRAAKLSRFFGVGYQDISSVPELLPSIFPKTEPPAPPAVQVDVKKTGRRIWGFSDGGSINMRDVDMLDVIDKLRDLKAA